MFSQQLYQSGFINLLPSCDYCVMKQRSVYRLHNSDEHIFLSSVYDVGGSQQVHPNHQREAAVQQTIF